MLKEGRTYALPLLLGLLILGGFHYCLASYLFQADDHLSTIPPLQRHVQSLQLPVRPKPLTAADPNPFFATLTEEQEDLALPEKKSILRLAGIIQKDEEIFALIEYAGSNKLYGLGDQLGAYQLQEISPQGVVLRGEQQELCLAMEKRP